MNSNQKKLQRMIREQSDALGDEELFCSSAYQRYLTNMAVAATNRYRQGLQVLLSWNPEATDDIACTDNYKIHINAANPITQSFPSRFLRSQSMAGLTGHETGHLRYSDFAALGLYLGSLQNGSFYPEDPETEGTPYQCQLNEMKDCLEKKDKAACLVLAKCASTVTNVMEDIYIEARMCQAFPGLFKQGIELNNLRMVETMPDLQSQIEGGYEGFAIMVNLILQYCRAGTVNNACSYEGPYLDALSDCILFVEEALYSDDIQDRFRAANQILVILWEYIKPLIEDAREKLQKMDEEDTGKELDKQLGGQLHGSTPLPSGKGGNLPKQCSTGKKEKQKDPCAFAPPGRRQQTVDEAQAVVAEEGGRIALAKTNTILDEKNPGITYNRQYMGSGYENAAGDLFRILNEVATEKAEAQYEQEMSDELQAAAQDIHYGNAHAGIHVTINRMCAVPESMIQDYRLVSPPMLRISRQLKKSIAPLLKEEREGGVIRNLQYGKRLDMRSLHHEDGTFFKRVQLPQNEGKLAVAFLADESGSMAWGDRITHVKKAAITLYDFCRGLDIPVTIYGHSTDDNGVALYSYAEFDSVGEEDRYRVMDMSARNGNRDGAALRFVAEHLMKRPEKRKLLIIASDGQPADYGYMGTEAEADLRGIKKEYEKKGIVIFAAAIGDDREEIRRIYQDGFLDITNLEELPKNMTLLVKQHLQ